MLDTVPPAAGGAVMGTGIVSVGLALDDRTAVSGVLLAIALVLWLGLAAIFGQRAVCQRRRWVEEARTPAALTAVAGTAVLGARLTQLTGLSAAELFLALTLCGWAALTPAVLRHWQTPTVGVSFVLVVATESIAVLAALVAIDRPSPGLAVAALAPLVLGLAAYLVVLAEADPRQLLTGLGDQWIAGGALAISTLACARITDALRLGGTLPGLTPILSDATLALWAAAAGWLPVLLVCELLRPRPGYDTRRWSTVFPFGMYAVCSLAAGHTTGVAALSRFGHAWLWIALAVWLAVFAGLLRRAFRAASRPARRSSCC